MHEVQPVALFLYSERVLSAWPAHHGEEIPPYLITGKQIPPIMPEVVKSVVLRIFLPGVVTDAATVSCHVRVPR
jgi:hypothetical protein